LSTVSMGDLAVLTLRLPRLMVVLVPGLSGTGGASHGATSIEVIGTGP
jgi:hypothetical protein